MERDTMEPGFDVPALPGMAEAEIQTPCLLIDHDAMMRNIDLMQARADEMGVGLRVHVKTHKSADIARRQIAAGACGICCQKVSEAEVFVRAGFGDVLVSNQVCDRAKIARLARLPLSGARVIVCVDDAANVKALSQAAVQAGSALEVLVEMDCGGGRCGVAPGAAVVTLARQIAEAPGLRFAGVQAYHGGAQHIYDRAAREAELGASHRKLRETLEELREAGLDCAIVGGAGTGSWDIEGASGLYTEMQCGSYVLMDADYARVQSIAGENGGGFEHALFVLSGVMSHVRPDHAVCDAGLKSMSADSGMPTVFGLPDVVYRRYSDEHGELDDPSGRLALNDRVRLVPGHVDPTCNLHDWFVVVRDGRVTDLWPVSARGRLW